MSQPGLVCVVADNRPAALTLPMTAGGKLLLGRNTGGIGDPRISRQHVEVSRVGRAWRFRDLGSRNGTFVDGRRVSECDTSWDGPALRIGDSLFLCLSDVDPARPAIEVSSSGLAAGACQQRIYRDLRISQPLLIVGQPGSGRGSLMRLLHEAARAPEADLHRIDCRAPASMLARVAGEIAHFSPRDTVFLDSLDALADQEPFADALAGAPELFIGGSARHHGSGPLHELLAGQVVDMPALALRREEIPWIIRRAVPLGIAISASFYYRAVLATWPGQVHQLLESLRGSLRHLDDGATLTAASLEAT